MTKLWLNFTDQKGEKRRAAVVSGRFLIGRHSGGDLCIPDPRLSREHAQIERYGDLFVVSDAGSSNGSKLNGSDLTDPVSLKNGDTLNLGGVEINVEMIADEPVQPPLVHSSKAAAVVNADTSGGGSIPASVFIIAPLLGLILLIFTGGLFYLLSSGNTTETANIEEIDPIIGTDKPNNDRNLSNSTDKPSTPRPIEIPSNLVTPLPQASPTNLSDTARVEFNGAAFLRKIAQNDPRAFLTGEQSQRVNAKVKQLSSSSAIADNINSARKNANQIRSIANAKNLKPQFLAVAAITKLGTSRGDVVQTAQSMADILDKLGTQIGNELAEDSLLMIAAYDQGAAGDTMKMRNMLQDLSNKFPESSRAIRTIWFLQKQGKITQSEFDRALSFLAIGTITQNPKDFGVNAEALSL